MVYAILQLAYPKCLCAYLKVNIYIICSMMSFLLEPSTTFYVTHNYDSVTMISC